jgi:hypothetical protein
MGTPRLHEFELPVLPEIAVEHALGAAGLVVGFTAVTWLASRVRGTSHRAAVCLLGGLCGLGLLVPLHRSEPDHTLIWPGAGWLLVLAWAWFGPPREPRSQLEGRGVFEVRGVDRETGRAVSIEVEAPAPEFARMEGEKAGITVGSVWKY